MPADSVPDLVKRFSSSTRQRQCPILALAGGLSQYWPTMAVAALRLLAAAVSRRAADGQPRCRAGASGRDSAVRRRRRVGSPRSDGLHRQPSAQQRPDRAAQRPGDASFPSRSATVILHSTAAEPLKDIDDQISGGVIVWPQATRDGSGWRVRLNLHDAPGSACHRRARQYSPACRRSGIRFLVAATGQIAAQGRRTHSPVR